MKNILIIVLFLIVAVQGFILFQNKDNLGATSGSGSVSSAGQSHIMSPPQFGGNVIATVNGVEITDEAVKDRLNFVTSGQAANLDLAQLDDKALEAIAKEVYVQQKILEEAYAAGIPSNPDLKDKVASLVTNIYKEKYLESIAANGVNKEEIDKIYEDLVSKATGSKQYKVKHILTKTEDEAKKAKTRLKSEKFEDVAKEVSVDKLSAANGGDLGFIFPAEFVEEFANKVKELKNGEVSSPVKTQFGWHIIKVEDSKDAEILPLEEAKPRIEKQLGTKAVKEHIDGLSQGLEVQLTK
jgi:peptidyl-prolyl cis-trans isomerase C